MGHRKWATERLEFSHEPSLSRRLKDLIKPFETAFCWLIGAEGNRRKQKDWCNKVIQAIKDSRNHLAHSLPEAGNDPGRRYHHFTIVTELLVAMWLMQEIGIDEPRINNRITKNFYTKQQRERIIEFLRKELR
jgi:hypothetical protein